jgi:hypothetical protein
MRYVLVALAALGMVVSALALREHYRTEGDAPCSINERWDCGIVNKSPYAMLAGVPVAALGIVGYLIMGALAWRRSYRFVLAVAFSRSVVHLLRHLSRGHFADHSADAGGYSRLLAIAANKKGGLKSRPRSLSVCIRANPWRILRYPGSSRPARSLR